jgi:insulysin
LKYFGHLIGHEGENSLLSYLKKEGLALEISACDDNELEILSDFFVDILLTKKGF